MIKILIVDDHPIVRQGLKQIVAEECDMQVLGEAPDAQGVIALVQRQAWDIVILDVQMPGRSGLDVLQELRRERPNLPVLILSVQPEDQYAVSPHPGSWLHDQRRLQVVKAIRRLLPEAGTSARPWLKISPRLEIGACGPCMRPCQSRVSGLA
jgi:CheY-like chemotaxis protein